ncbi:hypothetical protein CesoFtcFv8_015719 [Champsocephalus esox]|uniref:Uncharacterized protein n=1 Tax=Champsocephalus esox TaxID=159716 RepID=A0AAN8BLN5_9TELE|nr:hypothetical protein CesoFtcFv8_015719 [Champsocephalus esox]
MKCSCALNARTRRYVFNDQRVTPAEPRRRRPWPPGEAASAGGSWVLDRCRGSASLDSGSGEGNAPCWPRGRGACRAERGTPRAGLVAEAPVERRGERPVLPRAGLVAEAPVERRGERPVLASWQRRL